MAESYIKKKFIIFFFFNGNVIFTGRVTVKLQPQFID